MGLVACPYSIHDWGVGLLRLGTELKWYRTLPFVAFDGLSLFIQEIPEQSSNCNVVEIVKDSTFDGQNQSKDTQGHCNGGCRASRKQHLNSPILYASLVHNTLVGLQSHH
ncbi:hypothetical protein HBI56_111190 [Parastagonospora nodorum]|uniref:Uncharacterized protein n=1 Tax=Phaeosphaeria nodorum (strain SN15 / ATCC MYA-4574 / FGSC 10173) TaxID=321614 RepID=A0A7U2HW21_PHANO|nr:hypothetical protein HBH56_043800 [Parastagonospora nodorum]QRC92818.1 hypothetical protein JI435_403000 [Parastagonospora nodorum SN15]KAH3933051.1 hypothetical protein HBH54_071550 [Parastagonospora nodorum]KAH3946267.1 hypothetical protein HBH53_130740 [Parastagonospora nodorum]KAH3973160.1 hypothetical protein HBH52_143630 [Parastagonospora nodorum]